MSTERSERAKAALEKHDKGYNCAQSVTCVFTDKTNLDEKTLFRITEGMGLGMGGAEGTCGAISAAAILAGLQNSTMNLEHPDSKGTTYEAAKHCLSCFKEQNKSVTCKDLKGMETGIPLRSCNDCIADAVEIIEKELYCE